MGVQVEDHPLEYANFEGEIPPRQYGAGRVIVWDRGTWISVGDPRAGCCAGKLKFELRGEKLRGHWTLVRMRRGDHERRESWLLMKERDRLTRPASEYDITEALPDSVLFTPRAKSKASRRSPVEARRLSRPKATATRGRAAASKAATEEASVPGIKVTHPARLIDAASGTTKLDLVRYYDRIAQHMLPHLVGRPAALVRGPAGVGGELFFQKHVHAIHIPGIMELDPELSPGHPPTLEIATRQALVGAAQMNAMQFHTWNSTTLAIDRPDRVIFDLDPGEGVTWSQVLEATALVKRMLDILGLKSSLKTSGGKGLHVVVPITPTWDYDAVKDFSQAAVRHLANTLPRLFVAKSGASNRIGRVFVGYLRNGRGASTVAAFSARARPGLGVSVPLAWPELKKPQKRQRVEHRQRPPAALQAPRRSVERLQEDQAIARPGAEAPARMRARARRRRH